MQECIRACIHSSVVGLGGACFGLCMKRIPDKIYETLEKHPAHSTVKYHHRGPLSVMHGAVIRIQKSFSQTDTLSLLELKMLQCLRGRDNGLHSITTLVIVS
jgi:hypothetical protein